MSKVMDLWEGTIEVAPKARYVYLSCTERLPDGGTVYTTMELDAALTRKLIKKLKKALDEVEDV